MDRRGLCWWGRDLRYVFTAMGGIATLTYTPEVFRPGDFRLYRRVHKKAQGYPRASTHTVTPYEDAGPRLDHLLLYYADV
jgi:hypothetical protein